MYDIVVIGGGPAGCQAASILGRKGFDVHVLEEHSVIGEPVDCSGVIGAESFDALGLPGFLKRAEISSLDMVSPSGLKIRFNPLSPLAYIVDRAAFDQAVAETTIASGATIHLGTRVTDLRVTEDAVELEVTVSPPSSLLAAGDNVDRLPMTDNRPRSSVRAKMVILAGGPRYTFQEKLGMGRPKDFLKTAQTEVEIEGVAEPQVILGSQVAPRSFAWIVPFKKDERWLARVGVSSKTAARPYLEKLMDRLRTERRLKSPDPAIRSWVIPVSPITKTYSRRVLAVGDAAGQTKPTTGGGIYYGLLSADAAAETAVMAFQKGNFDAGTLSHYETAWRRSLGRDIRIGAFFRRLVERLTDREIDDLFRIVQSDGILASVARKARFDYHRDVIFFALRHPQLGRIFLRGLFR